MVNSNNNDGITGLGEVVSRAEKTAHKLVDLAHTTKTIQLQTRRQMNQLQSELHRTTALHRLIYNDQICQLETSSTTFRRLAPADLNICRYSFRRANETLRVFEQSPAAVAAAEETSLASPQYPKLLLETHRQLKALNDEIRADVVLAIKRVLNQDLFSRDTRAVQLRDIAVGRDPSLEHDIWQIRIQRGDAPLIASLLLANDDTCGNPDVDGAADGGASDSASCLRFRDANTIVETRAMPQNDPNMCRKTLKLATFLHAVRSPYLLRCTGFRIFDQNQDRKRKQRLEYLYDASPLQGCRRAEIHRLSEHLGSPTGHFTRGRREAAARILSDKIRFAGQLARAVSELHAVDRVHGAVRAENVWFGVRGGEYEAKVSVPLLVGAGFEEGELRRCRVVGGDDDRGDGGEALEEGKMRDILALGVLLLELGLGRSVAEATFASASASTSTASSLGGAGSGVGVGAVAAAEHLGTLNAVMGGRYTAAVRAALDPRQLAMMFSAMEGEGEGRGGGESEDEDESVFDARGSCGLDRAFRGVVVDELLGVVGRA
ncbi:hypothetical protein BDP55DRAFT_634727 [Colletotrichum godetiae]|uniref:Protein kinase domain-containing protein n=1 Tax=Colletotrichum godetiae TaxID=1209918 RepID=A0AAJ0AHU5_9PEZI|nr:uncharacterized protein BDP55DRAFT_634727 [Colletotrichum godetiae]KAK1672718.1 hypothetical protein BDP55DRAFT_634727 [Colletotrichum godetiae]